MAVDIDISNYAAMHTLNALHDEQLTVLVKAYPIFTGLALTIYFLIFTYLLLRIHHHYHG